MEKQLRARAAGFSFPEAPGRDRDLMQERLCFCGLHPPCISGAFADATARCADGTAWAVSGIRKRRQGLAPSREDVGLRRRQHEALQQHRQRIAFQHQKIGQVPANGFLVECAGKSALSKRNTVWPCLGLRKDSVPLVS